MIQSTSLRVKNNNAGKLFVATATAACLMMASPWVAAQTKEALYVASLAANCAACHGTQGAAATGSAVASLAGMQKDYFVTQMKAFQTGTRPATVMHQLSKGYSAAQIEQMAAYFAAQKK